jgi:mono/diheme cytochrome c family protein
MSRWFVLGLPGSLALACALGCFTGGGDPGTGDGGTGSGLPCDVAQALSSCQACHGSSPAVGVPFSLITYSDLTATSPTYSDQTVAQRAVARMSDGSFPMAPHPLDAAPQSDIDTIQAWIDAGYPAGDCTPPPGGTNPYDTPMACTNGKSTITFGSQSMRPGEACIDCHTKNFGPFLTVAGTVYPTAHESNDCKGSNVTSASIIITDKNNKTLTLHPNSAGNFYSQTTVTAPYTVKLTYQGRERDMTGLVVAPTNGDCNSCHTADGSNGAPGRIMLP